MSENTLFTKQTQRLYEWFKERIEHVLDKVNSIGTWHLDYNNSVDLAALAGGVYTPPATGWVASKSGVLFLYSYFVDGHGSLSGWINGTHVFYIGSGSSSGQISVPVTKGDIVQFKNVGANASGFGNCSFRGFRFVPYK